MFENKSELSKIIISLFHLVIMRDSCKIINDILNGDILELSGIKKINCIWMMIYWVVILNLSGDSSIETTIFGYFLWWVPTSNAVDQILVDNLLLTANSVDKVPNTRMVAIEGLLQPPVRCFGVIIRSIHPCYCAVINVPYVRTKHCLNSGTIKPHSTRVIDFKPINSSMY
jgi:hypothetical protein